MEPTEHQVNANGIDIAYLACGDDGPLALCLHGFPDSAHTWRHLLPDLAAAGFRAVAPWTRGYAPTDVPASNDYDIGTLAADVNALHDALGGDEDAALVGHDWGAITAYRAGQEAPRRWRRMVALAVPPPAIAAGAFTSYDQLKRSFYIFLFQTDLAPLIAMDDLAFIDRLWADWSSSYDASDDLPHVKDALRDTRNLMAAIGYYRAMFASGGAGDGSPPQPTLYLHGDADGAFLVAGTAGSAEALSAESQVTVVPGVGHF